MSLDLFNPFRKAEQQTGINCLVIHFTVKDGFATREYFVLDTSRTSVIGTGSVDLRNETLNLSFQPSPKKGVGIKGLAKFNINTGVLWKTFMIGGTLAKPTLVFDVSKASVAALRSIGRLFFLGPLALASSFKLGTKAKQNPCLAAIEALKQLKKGQKQ